MRHPILQTPTQAPNRVSRLNRVEWLLLIVALALAGLGFAYVHAHETQRIHAAESNRLQALTTVLGNDVASNLGAANRALEGIIAYQQPGLQGNPSHRLTALADAMPGIRTLSVLDTVGIVTASSDAQFMGKNFSHRGYFRAVRAHPSKTMLYVSAPFQSMHKDLTMNVSRMVAGPRGEFSGLVMATLDPDYFIRVFRAAMYAPDVWGGIAHGDGIKFLNFPVKAGVDGVNFDQPGSLFRRHRDSGRVGSVLTGTMQATGESRLAASHTIQPVALAMDKPLMIMLSRDLHAIKQPLLREAISYALFYGALVLLCCAGLYWMQIRRAQVRALGAGRERDRLQADQRMQVALRGANLGLWSFDVAAAALALDDNSLAILGLAAPHADAAFWPGRIHRDDLPAYVAVRDACIDGSAPCYEVTYRIRHQDGHWAWILARGQAVARDEQGRAIALMGTHLDLTDIKNAEQEVLRSRNELEVIFDNLTEAVLVLGNDGKVIHSNRVARNLHALFGSDFSLEQMIGGIDLVLPDGQMLQHAQWPMSRGLLGDFVKNFEVEIRRKDTGAAIFVDCSTAPIRDGAGAIDVLIVTFMDVTERRRIHALRDSEARFRTLIEDAPLAIAMLRAGHFIYANPRYRALHAYLDSDDLNGRPWRMMLSDASGALLQAEQASIALDRPVELMFEAEGLGKDGRLVPMFKTTARALLADGPATLIFAQDISAQKGAEAAMLQALDGAEKANRSKAEFLANMSHEIRSPLNAILGLAYLLEQAHLDLDAHDMVRKIRSSGRLLLGIINDILDVSKIEAGHMTIEQAPFRLADVIDNLATAMGIAAGEKNIELIIHPLPPGVAMVGGDALRLEQVLLNLTSNAIKFTEAGRVTLHTELLSRSDDKVLLRFCVQDTGIGIAAALQGDIFSAFTQADSSTTRRFGGSGLGLAICRQLVDLMKGDIGLTSAPGQGSQFWFTLTLLAIPDADFSAPDMVRIDALIADDSAIALHAIGSIAQSLGWQVNAVASGQAALSHMQQLMGKDKGGKLPDVVLLDWKMPGMDGLATARAIRESLQQQCPIVIMATAHALTSLADAPGAELVDAMLHKPVTASALYNAVTQAKRLRAAHPAPPRQMAGHGLAGVRLLIVDDSEINREVAQRILRDQGAVVTLAVDGLAALNWLLDHPDRIDLILMDVQMPVMDGIEATRKLRRLPQFDAIPIVALTAGAFQSQQDAARAAGMTDFVSKPFDVPKMIALILRLMARRKLNLAPIPSDDAIAQPCAPGSAVIDVARGLQLWSDLQAYRDYLRHFVDSYGDAVDVMNASLALGDLAAAAALAHKLAGVAGNLALLETHRVADEAERVLVSGHDPSLVLAQLREALLQAVAEIGLFAPEPAQQAGAPSAIAAADLAALLQDLMATLGGDDPGPVEPVLAVLARHVTARQLKTIARCVRSFDFRGAEVAALELARQFGISLGKAEKTMASDRQLRARR
jgi:PAS domain S-box-containing protein